MTIRPRRAEAALLAQQLGELKARMTPCAAESRSGAGLLLAKVDAALRETHQVEIDMPGPTRVWASRGFLARLLHSILQKVQLVIGEGTRWPAKRCRGNT